MNPRPLLNIFNLKTHFFLKKGVVKAVDGINLKIGREEILGLVGESGCGKSMTAYSILRLIPTPPGRIVGGQILFENEDLLRKTEREMREIRGKKISMIFQDPGSFLNPVYKVGDQIAESIRLHQDLGRKKVREKTLQVMEIVKIPDANIRIDAYPHQFSGGMKQRILLAIAISCNPTLILADEPTTALDVTIQAQILDLLSELREKFHTSILLITHDLGVIAQLCDKVAVMYCGRIVEYADIFHIFKNPAHPYTRGLLQSIPMPFESREKLPTIKGNVAESRNMEGCEFAPRCSQANDICLQRKPPEVNLEQEHTVACFLYE
jgi:oligopeptide/dipeptide ABC transporter ATP-binding protein